MIFRPGVGVSTSVLAEKNDLDSLLVYEPDVIEFYNYPASALPSIQRFCCSNGVRPALHTPVPFDGPEPLTRFAPTGPNVADARLALRLAIRTVECAAALNAQHVVVHFPSPYPPYPKSSFDEACAAFLEPLQDSARREGVLVLLENLTPHPLLNMPIHYQEIVDSYPDLGFCLDVGHAHLLRSRGALTQFIEVLGPAIRSVHLYNTTPKRRRWFGHEPVGGHQRTADGFADIAAVVRQLVALSQPDTLILEHDPVDQETGKAAANWTRGLINGSNTYLEVSTNPVETPADWRTPQ